MVQLALCSSSTNRNCKSSVFLFREPRLPPLFHLFSNTSRNCNYGVLNFNTLVHRSAFKNSAKFRQTFSHFCNRILKILFRICNSGPKVTKCHQLKWQFLCFFGISAICTENEKSTQFTENGTRLKSPSFFSNFLVFRNEYS